MSKVHFITYGSDDSWVYALDRIAHEARRCGAFDSVTCYTPAMLDRDFAARYASVLKQARGGGFWIWKHQIIRQKLNEVGDGDAVVYADAGFHLNHNNSAQLRQHIGELEQSDYGMLAVRRGDFGATRMTNRLIGYFKDAYGIDDGYKRDYGVEGGALIFLKNEHAYKILDAFGRLLQTDMDLITDAYSAEPQHPDFRGDSRHDQAILSLIARVFGCVRLNQNEWWHGDRFFMPLRMTSEADIGGMLRIHGARALAPIAAAIAGRVVADFKTHRAKAPWRIAKKYLRRRRLKQSGRSLVYIDNVDKLDKKRDLN